MAIPNVSRVSEALAKVDPLIAEVRDLDDYHTACDADLVIEGTVNGRRVRFDPILLDLSGPIKKALEARVADLTGKIEEALGNVAPVRITSSS